FVLKDKRAREMGLHVLPILGFDGIPEEPLVLLAARRHAPVGLGRFGSNGAGGGETKRHEQDSAEDRSHPRDCRRWAIKKSITNRQRPPVRKLGQVPWRKAVLAHPHAL